MKLARNRRKAPAAGVGNWRASRMPQVVNGGTNAVAIATPTTTELNPVETKVNPPASPPTRAIKRSTRLGEVRARISLPMVRSRVDMPISTPDQYSADNFRHKGAPEEVQVGLSQSKSDPNDWTIEHRD